MTGSSVIGKEYRKFIILLKRSYQVDQGLPEHHEEQQATAHLHSNYHAEKNSNAILQESVFSRAFLVSHQYNRNIREGIRKINRTGVKLPSGFTIALILARIRKMTMQINENKPPFCSFPQAHTNPARPRNQKTKVVICTREIELKEIFPLRLYPSIDSPKNMIRVNKTRRVPIIRAVQRRIE